MSSDIDYAREHYEREQERIQREAKEQRYYEDTNPFSGAEITRGSWDQPPWNK